MWSKIERTLHKLRREAWRNPEENDLAFDSLFASNLDLEEKVVMFGNWTLKVLVASDLNQQPSCIIFFTLDTNSRGALVDKTLEATRT